MIKFNLDRRRVAALAACACFLALAAPPAYAAEARRLERIVSLGGAVTEILYRLGAGDLVAAVDTTSIHPFEETRAKPNVGYLRQLSAEGILSVRPDLVIAAEGRGPRTRSNRCARPACRSSQCRTTRPRRG